MRLYLIILIFLLPNVVMAGTGLNLVSDCEQAEKLWAGKAGIKEKGVSCSSLIKGVLVTMVMTANSSDKETAYRMGLCNPINHGKFIPLEQAILVVNKYLRDNPKELQKQDFVLVMVALKESFSCPKP